MRRYIDLDSLELKENPDNFQGVPRLIVKRGTVLPLEIQFVRKGVPQLMPEGTTLAFRIKRAKGYDTEALAAATGTAWTTPDTELGFYSARVTIASVALDALLNVDSNTENDLDSVNAICELAWLLPGDTRPSKSRTVPVLIENDVNRGDEGVPDEADPPYPSPESIIIFRADLTALTGGADSLDSLLLGTGHVGRVFALVASDEGVESHWRVDAGTEETNAPGGVVRPANYADGTNEVVLHRIC